MICYKAAYRVEDGVFIGEVLDFPGTVSFGKALDDARENLASALVDMAETNLLRGEGLPVPDATRTDPEAELEEPIYLVLHAGHRLSVTTSATP